MRELGHSDGRTYVTDWRFANGRYVRVIEFAQEFVRLKVDVIFLGSSATVDFVQQVTRTIPIVLGYSVDPVGSKVVASLARPGGNITGMVSSGEDPAPRHLELLAAVVPGLARVGFLQNPESQNYTEELAATRAAAQKVGAEVLAIDARNPPELETALAAFAREQVGAIRVASDAFFFSQTGLIAEHALRHRLPSVYPQRDFTFDGGLMSYGENIREFYRRAAAFVDRILKGAKAAELPMEQPAKLHLAINRRTAAALGLTIPPQVLAEADEVFG